MNEIVCLYLFRLKYLLGIWQQENLLDGRNMSKTALQREYRQKYGTLDK